MAESALKVYRERIDPKYIMRGQVVSALPKPLQTNLEADGDGTDLDNAAQKYFSRAWTAYSINADPKERDWFTLCGIPFTKHRICLPFKLPSVWRRFPKLIAGKNIARWMGERDRSVLEIPGLMDKWIFWWQMKGEVLVIERQEGRPDTDIEWITDWETILKNYGPSPIQAYTKKNFQVSWPLIVAGTWDGEPEERRKGYVSYIKRKGIRLFGRWDSWDDYHVCPAWGPSN